MLARRKLKRPRLPLAAGDAHQPPLPRPARPAAGAGELDQFEARGRLTINADDAPGADVTAGRAGVEVPVAIGGQRDLPLQPASIADEGEDAGVAAGVMVRAGFDAHRSAAGVAEILRLHQHRALGHGIAGHARSGRSRAHVLDHHALDGACGQVARAHPQREERFGADDERCGGDEAALDRAPVVSGGRIDRHGDGLGVDVSSQQLAIPTPHSPLDKNSTGTTHWVTENIVILGLSQGDQGMGHQGNLQGVFSQVLRLGVAHQAPAVDIAHPVQHS